MKKETALRWLRKRYLECRPRTAQRFRPRQIPEDIYERSLIRELIRWIEQSKLDDPIEIVWGFYKFLDDVLCESGDDQPKTHTFVSHMEMLTGDILWDLRRLRKETEE